MHIYPDFKTKKGFKEAVKSGDKVRVVPGPFESPNVTGTVYIEGPAEYHKWYAQCEAEEGVIVSVS